MKHLRSMTSLRYVVYLFLLWLVFLLTSVGVALASGSMDGITSLPVILRLLVILTAALLIFLGPVGWLIGKQINRLELSRSELLEKADEAVERESELLIEVSERTRLEKTLERGKREWEGIFDAVQDSIIVVDHNGAVIRCNKSAIRELDTTFEQLVNSSAENLVIGERDGQPYKLAGISGEVFNPASQHWFDIAKYPLYPEQDKSWWIYILHDITERKRDESIIREQKEFLEALIDTSPVAIITTDMEGTVISCNPAFEIMFGYSSEEVIGFKADQLPINASLHREALEMAEQVMQAERVHKNSQRCRRDGSLIDVEIAGVPMILEGCMAGALWIYHDITEIMQARRSAEQADQAKSEFLANISHEIRTPMNGIIGMIDLTLETKLNDEQYDFLVGARESAEALLSVLNGVLDFSKIEAGQLQLENVQFDLRSVVEGVTQTMANRAEAKGLELLSFVETSVPASARGDPGRLRQVLINLVENAIKFTEQGEVLVYAELAGGTDTHTTVQFFVIDTGIGIPLDRQQAIFGRFVQADGSTTRRYGGTGLGLTISKELVEMMGGSIKLESSPGVGSTFSFTVVLEKVAQQPAREELAKKLEGVRVLIVDDNPTNRRIFSKMLESFGCEVATVSNGMEVIPALFRGLLTSTPFDLVLLDMQMPGMDGERTLREIRNESLTQDIKVIILTSIGRRNELSRVYELGCSGYLVKPIRQSQLQGVIQDALEMRKEAQRQSRGQSAALAAQVERRNILVVEDNEMNQKMVSIMLSRQGHSIEVASNGLEAIDAFQSRTFDIIFMDVQMPVMDGLEACRRIRELEEENEHVPIVAMTAHVMQGDVQRCLDAGMDDYLSKPIDTEHVSQMIRSLTNGVHKQVSLDSMDLVEPNPDDEALLLDIELALPFFGHDLEYYRSFYDEFISTLPEKLDEMRKDFESKNWKALSDKAHNLKGVSANLGAMQLSALAFKLDRQSTNGRKDFVGETLNEIGHTIDQLSTKAIDLFE